MSVTINLGAWRSVFAVPSQIVDEGLKYSDGVKLKVLLYVLRHAGEELEYKSISQGTGVNVTDIPETLDYWVSLGVLQKDGSLYEPPKAEAQPASVAEIEPVIEPELQPEEPPKPRFTVAKPQKPDYVFTAQQLAVDDELKFLVSEAQTALGKVLSNADVSTLLMLKDTCGLPLDVILMLIQYAISIDKGNMRTVEKLGVRWADDGVDSVEAAENKIRLATQRTKCYSIVATAFGLKNAGSPSKKQLDYCSAWVTEWKFSPEMLREAYERCVDAKGEMKFNYIDGILRRWHAAGIHNLSELKESEQKKTASKKEPPRNQSYNIDQLDEINKM